MNINKALDKYLDNNEIFKSKDLIIFLQTETNCEKSKATNFAYVSLNRMKNGKDKYKRNVTSLGNGYYFNKKLSIDEIWEAKKNISTLEESKVSKAINEHIKNRKLVTSGVTYAFENSYSKRKTNINSYTSKAFLQTYVSAEEKQLINYDYVEYSTEIKKIFPDHDELELRRIITSLRYIKFDDKLMVDNFLKHLAYKDIDFFKFIKLVIKEYKTPFEKEKNFKIVYDEYNKKNRI
ncbi:MAG: hypothetical protein HRS57_00890 [Mycoplasmataceae bacterium]|nr:hypothetical protein [Mycoplasmataceae bacterium]